MSCQSDEHKYDAIINLPHHRSKKRKHMSMTERAAQFGAFRALTGYEDEIAETARLTEDKTELDEYAKAEINARLRYIKEHTEEAQEVFITYFVPDAEKAGGAYVTAGGTVRKIKELERLIVLENGTEIPIDEIVLIEGKSFNNTEE